jgi:hypothetical protein
VSDFLFLIITDDDDLLVVLVLVLVYILFVEVSGTMVQWNQFALIHFFILQCHQMHAARYERVVCYLAHDFAHHHSWAQLAHQILLVEVIKLKSNSLLDTSTCSLLA